MVQSSIALKDLEVLIKNDTAKLFILYFTGSVDTNGSSWCPDCNDAKSTYNSILDNYSKKASIYSFYIERNQWKDKNNEYRTNKVFSVDSVPTLLLFKDGINLLRKKEEELYSFDKVKGFIDDALEY